MAGAPSGRAARDAWKTMLDLFFEGEGHRRIHGAADAVGVSPGVMKALLHLDPRQGVPMRDLAEKFGCDASYITALVDGLEERGMASRHPHPTDRRVKIVMLTDSGVAARVRVIDQLHEPPPSFEALTAAEQRQLRDLLQKVADADPRLVSTV